MEEKKLVPKLRFPGFTEPWEQRKFGELFILKSGVAFKLSEYTKTGIPIINGESIKAGKISLEKVNYLPNEYQYKYQECLLFPGDIVLGLNRPIIDGELKISRIPSDIKTCLLYQRAGKIIFKVNMEENFTYQLLSKEVLTFTRREAVGSDQPFITTTKLNKWNLYLPVKDEERRKIGNLLDNINNIITLHQRKLEHLKLKKKSLLQKLFPKEGEVYPELRFPGFTAPWEQRKLGEIVERVTRKNNGQSDRPLTISAQDGLVDQCEYFDRQVASRDMSNYYLIKKGEFAYNKSYSDGYPFGAIKRLDYYDKGALSTLYIIFKIVDDRIGSDFMVAYYMTSLWYKEISKRAAEGARNHGLLNISTEDFFNSELKIPNDIKEQIKVGKFVNQFDQYITLHQRKLEHLQLLKKALLQQLFV